MEIKEVVEGRIRRSREDLFCFRWNRTIEYGRIRWNTEEVC
jgi:hypothetical protein